MSRSGYVDDDDNGDNWSMIRWRGAVASAIKGNRGQQFLRDLLSALDAMPVKELHAGKFQADGQFCALGVAANFRAIDLSGFEEGAADGDVAHGRLAKTLELSEAFVREVMFENDECVSATRTVTHELCGPVRPHYPDYGQRVYREKVEDETAPARRWAYMRGWVAKQIVDNAGQRAGGGE